MSQAKGFISVLGVKLLAAVSALLVQVFVGRFYGAAGVGTYVFGLSMLSVLETISRRGLGQTFTNGGAWYAANNDWLGLRRYGLGLLKRVVNSSLCIGVIAASVYVGAVQYGASPWGLWTLLPFFAALPSVAITRFQASGLLLTSPSLASAADAFWIHPLFVCTLAASSMLAGAQNWLIGASYAAACCMAVAINSIAWAKSFPKTSSEAVIGVPKTSVNPDTRGFFIFDLLDAAVQNLPILVVGILLTPSETGLFGICTRIAGVFAFFLYASRISSMGAIARFYAEGRLRELEATVRLSMTLPGLFAFPLLIFVFTFPAQILALFGQEFVGMAGPLRIIALAQYINVSTGPAAAVLTMIGKPRTLIPVYSGASLALVGVLGATLGLFGYGVWAAILVTALVLAAYNILVYRTCQKALPVRLAPLSPGEIWAHVLGARVALKRCLGGQS